MTTPAVSAAVPAVIEPKPAPSAANARGFARPPLLVQRLSERATVPKYQSELAAGLDLAACLPAESPTLVIEPGAIAVVPTGLAVGIEPGYEGQVRPRSGLASRHGVTLPNAPGTIDADYRGQVFIPLINLGRQPFTVEHGMRIAQLIIAPVAQAEIRLVDSLEATQRGVGGFGSTGTK